MTERRGPWSANDLGGLLIAFEAELRDAGLEESTIRTYVDRSTDLGSEKESCERLGVGERNGFRVEPGDRCLGVGRSAIISD
jgi:hypothetical protein